MTTQYVSMEFDAKQMIRLLGNDLYDSPLAMLRENIQNSYDAILERMRVDVDFMPSIDITINNNQIIIKDNGIGMNENILANNYWKAGNSSKNNPESIAAGVVGHFGIGALANFGVCTKLEIVTRRYGENVCYRTEAIRDKLNLKDSIPIIGTTAGEFQYGTSIIATLEIPGSITVENARNYIKQYVEYINVPVCVNGTPIPQKKIDFIPKIENLHIHDSMIEYTLNINYGKNMPLHVEILINNIKYAEESLSGFIYLNTNDKTLLGLRNGFGLSNINLNTIYNWGGVVNLDKLVPTAGREAISRESILIVQTVLKSVEKQWSNIISKDYLCDQYREFIIYASNNYNDSIVKNIRIKLANEDIYIYLGEINKENSHRYKYADGVDSSILAKFKNSDECVLSVSDNSYRKRIQRLYLQSMGVLSIPNDIQILKVYSDKEISTEQYLILSEFKYIIEEDYYVKGFDIKFADISHMLNVYVTHDIKNNSFCIYISPNNSEVLHLAKIRSENYRLFTPIAKDFVRVVLYQQFSAFIPRGIKERTDYITKVLHNTKDEYVIPYEMMGTMDEMINKLRLDEISPEEFIKFAKAERNKHQQTINPSQVGDVTEVVASVQDAFLSKNMPVNKSSDEDLDIIPMPPILCLDVDTKLRILKTDINTPTLNNNKMFMALTDKMVNSKRIFFTNPHTTRVIWSMHRLIYIFTDTLGANTLYYDLELTHKIPNSTGGHSIKSTTIITKDKIFVPIVEELYDYFDLKTDEKLKFYVHFDEINND